MSQEQVKVTATKKELERLGKAANDALFALHTYFDACEIPRASEVFTARCRVGEIVYWEFKRLEHEADALAERKLAR